MPIQVKKLITKPTTMESDMLAFISGLGPITTVHSVGYIGTNALIANEPQIVVVVVFS